MGDKAKPLAAYPPTALLFVGSEKAVIRNAITVMYKERAEARQAFEHPFDAP
jgi:hypothetical protein